MARFTYIPNRVIDSDGISDGANIYFFQVGTTTPVSVYSDAALTTPVSNPYAVATGAAVPALYYAESSIRVRVVDNSGAVVSDDDPYRRPIDQVELSASTGTSLVGHIASGAGATARTVEDKLRDFVSVKDFGATGDGVADDTAEIQAAIDALGSNGGYVYLPAGTYKVSSAINIPLAVWKPVVIYGSGNTVVNSTHDGTVINDSTGNIRVEDIRFVGPGLSNTSAKAIVSFLSQGYIKGCYFQDYRVGIDITGSSGALIERCHFTLCQEGVRSVQASPAFSNFATIRSCWFDFCTFGAYLDEVFGLVLDNNAWESNAVGLFANSVRLIEMRGTNWFESNTTNAFQIDGSSTGTIGKQTRIVGNGYTIDHTTSQILDNYLPAICIVQRTNALSVAHNTDTSITFPTADATEILDLAGMHDLSTNTDRITISSAGLYEIKGIVEMAAFTPVSGNTIYARLGIWKNGSAIKNVTVPMLDNQPTQISISSEEKLSNGDYLWLVVYQNTGGALNLNAGTKTQFSVRQVSID